MMLLGGLLLVGQALVVWLLLRFVRTFGAYTNHLVATHRTALLIQTEQVAMLADIKKLKGAA